MDIRLKAMHAVAIVLAAGVLLSAFTGRRPATSIDESAWSGRADSAPRAVEPRHAVLGRCVENAQLIHDLHWAAACMQVAEHQRAEHRQCMAAGTAQDACDAQFPRDDGPDCTLPTVRASVLNAAIEAAEDRCVAEAQSLAKN